MLHNGIDPRTGERLGLETGDPRNFRTFDELMEAVKKQLVYCYRMIKDGIRSDGSLSQHQLSGDLRLHGDEGLRGIRKVGTGRRRKIHDGRHVYHMGQPIWATL